MSGSTFRGEKWEIVSTRIAKKIACAQGYPEGMWELFLGEANRGMLRELANEENTEQSQND
jgi:hypothetical protein